MDRSPAFAAAIVNAMIFQREARAARTLAARRTALQKARAWLRRGAAITGEPDDRIQIALWIKRLDARGRPKGAKNKKNRPPKMVEMFPENENCLTADNTDGRDKIFLIRAHPRHPRLE